MKHWNPKVKATKLFIVGLVFILVRLYTTWDIWIVIGILMILKAIWVYFRPCCCVGEPKKKK